MEVSIIVPVFNCEKFLKRCLDSLINQTLKDIEIICVNDGSTDNSLKILEEYSTIDNRIKIISTENKGQSAARNLGMSHAKGEYIGFVDSDDWVDLDFYEKLFKTAKKYNADIAVAGFKRVQRYTNMTKLEFKEEYTTTNTKEKLKICDVPEHSYVWNKIYNRKKLLETGISFEEGIIYEDTIYTPQALYYTNSLVTVPDTFYNYWRHGNSTVRLKTKKAKSDSEYAHQKALNFINEHGIDISEQRVFTKRYKIFGITIFKTQKRNGKTKYILFNIIKW